MKPMLKKIENVSIKHFLVAFLVSLPISVWLLRQNNLHMVNQREEIIKIDSETGDISQISDRIQELGDYIIHHMNTNMGSPLELPGTYNTAVEQIRLKVERSGSVNSQVYADAQLTCEDPFVLLVVRAQCIQEYVSNNSVPGSSPEELEFPDKALYSYSFVSPLWSPDFAGISSLVTLLSLISVLALTVSRVALPAVNRWIDSDPLE